MPRENMLTLEGNYSMHGGKLSVPNQNVFVPIGIRLCPLLEVCARSIRFAPASLNYKRWDARPRGAIIFQPLLYGLKLKSELLA
jgi:hypothetical protein